MHFWIDRTWITHGTLVDFRRCFHWRLLYWIWYGKPKSRICDVCTIVINVELSNLIKNKYMYFKLVFNHYYMFFFINPLCNTVICKISWMKDDGKWISFLRKVHLVIKCSKSSVYLRELSTWVYDGQSWREILGYVWMKTLGRTC